MIITNERVARVGYFITSYPTQAHGIIVIYVCASSASCAILTLRDVAFDYSVCRPKLAVNICINWLPIIINLSVILGSQYSLNLFLLCNKCKKKNWQKREK